MQLALIGLALYGGQQITHQLGEVQRVGRSRVLTGLQAGQQQQGVDAALHPRAGGHGGVQAALGQGGVGIGQGAFGTDADFRYRRAQLMRHVARKAPLARNGGVQVVQAEVEGVGKRAQLTRKVRAHGCDHLVTAQRGQGIAGALQYTHHTLHLPQSQPCGQRGGQHNAQQQGEMDAPLGAVPAFSLAGQHQQVRARLPSVGR